VTLLTFPRSLKDKRTNPGWAIVRKSSRSAGAGLWTNIARSLALAIRAAAVDGAGGALFSAVATVVCEAPSRIRFVGPYSDSLDRSATGRDVF
jgi:hypothetical protein